MPTAARAVILIRDTRVERCCCPSRETEACCMAAKAWSVWAVLQPRVVGSLAACSLMPALVPVPSFCFCRSQQNSTR
jgi:hypothetical protein